MAVVYPEPAEFGKIYNELLALVGNPKLLPTTTDGPILGIVVPDDAYEKWAKADPPAKPAPVKRAPGRPKKEPAS